MSGAGFFVVALGMNWMPRSLVQQMQRAAELLAINDFAMNSTIVTWRRRIREHMLSFQVIVWYLSRECLEHDYWRQSVAYTPH